MPMDMDLIVPQEHPTIKSGATNLIANQKKFILTHIRSYLLEKGPSSFVILFSTFSFFFFLFSVLFRKKFITVIPISLFYVAWAFVVIPTFYIVKNDKLRNFFVHEIDDLLQSWYKLLRSLKQLKSKVTPYNIESQQ